MLRVGRLIHTSSGTVLLNQVRWCQSFLCKLCGLMFRCSLEPGEGLLMAETLASRPGTAIHMLFMFFPIAVMWLDDGFRVVDAVYAKPWRLLYMPVRAARYTLEAHPNLLKQITIGDLLRFEEYVD